MIELINYESVHEKYVLVVALAVGKLQVIRHTCLRAYELFNGKACLTCDRPFYFG